MCLLLAKYEGSDEWVRLGQYKTNQEANVARQAVETGRKVYATKPIVAWWIVLI